MVILIIRSGDVHVNPGPNNNMIHTTQSVISDDFQHFSKRGLGPTFFATKTNAAVIGITESWLDDSVEDSEVEVCGYTILRHDRNIHGGGAYTSVVTFRFLPVLTSKQTTLKLFGRKSICYRPPRQSAFFDILELSINEGHCLNECILLGDFNTDMLLPTNNVLTFSQCSA